MSVPLHRSLMFPYIARAVVFILFKDILRVQRYFERVVDTFKVRSRLNDLSFLCFILCNPCLLLLLGFPSMTQVFSFSPLPPPPSLILPLAATACCCCCLAFLLWRQRAIQSYLLLFSYGARELQAVQAFYFSASSSSQRRRSLLSDKASERLYGLIYERRGHPH